MTKKKNLILINGNMGSGKSTVSEELNKNIPNSVWLDGDWCWMMKPFIVNEETKKMVLDNIVHLLRNFLCISHIENVIFNWVMDQEEIFDELLSPLIDLEFNLYKFTLICSNDVLINRIQGDIDIGTRDKDNIRRSLERQDSFLRLNTTKIDTDKKSIKDIARSIETLINKSF